MEDTALAALATVAREQVLAGLESITANRPTLEDISFGVTDAADLLSEFSALEHVGIDVLLSVPSGERMSAALMVALPDLGALLGIETSAERMSDPDFARAQLEMVSAASREFFDLISMTLFAETLKGVEAVPSGARLGDADATVSTVAVDAPLVRIDVGMALPAGASVHIVALLPERFLDALGISLDGLTGADFEPTPLRREESAPFTAPGAAPLFGLDFEAPARPTREDVDVHPVRFPPLTESVQMQAERRSLDLIMDVSMRVTVELGRSSLTVEEVLSLGPGSVVELNKLAGEPVDVLVNDQLVAHGEVVVVDENFGVRVTEIVSPRRRAQAMGA
jgi:flagellar motor switch protein FliN/FliY